MSTIIDTQWSQDRRELTIRRQVEGGVLKTTYQWDEPPSEQIVRQALAERDLPNSNEADAGAGHRASRHRLPLGLTLYVHHDWGPPRWTLPRLRVRINRERVGADIGWLYRCYGLTLARTPTETAG